MNEEIQEKVKAGNEEWKQKRITNLLSFISNKEVEITKLSTDIKTMKVELAGLIPGDKEGTTTKVVGTKKISVKRSVKRIVADNYEDFRKEFVGSDAELFPVKIAASVVMKTLRAVEAARPDLKHYTDQFIIEETGSTTVKIEENKKAKK